MNYYCFAVTYSNCDQVTHACNAYLRFFKLILVSETRADLVHVGLEDHSAHYYLGENVQNLLKNGNTVHYKATRPLTAKQSVTTVWTL